jgi:DNA invertase Pin-like site-specific DNA recombinase
VYVDHGISGAKGRDKRPAFDRMCQDAARGKLDIVGAWSIDRLGRSLHHVANFMAELLEQNVALYLHQQNVDGTTSSGKAMLGMAAVFAEFERSCTIDRLNAGLARARAEGKLLGRPRVRPKIEDRIRTLRAEGAGKLKIAKHREPSRQHPIGAGRPQRRSNAFQCTGVGSDSAAPNASYPQLTSNTDTAAGHQAR